MAFWDNWFQGIAQWISNNGWNDFPTSAGVIVVVSLLISLFSVAATRLLTDVEALKESMQKVNEWNQRRKKAMQTADKKLWLSVKRDEERIKKMQSSMMFKRMKPMLVTTIPFFIIFAILRQAYRDHYYAWLPFNIGQFPWIGGTSWFQPWEFEGHWYSKAPFTLWYFIVSFAFGSIISRIFGVTPSGAAPSKKKKSKREISRISTSKAREQLAKTKRTNKEN
ncbi:MAG: EMC3/TMCO1 family protein [Candidatus Heimdallarchaeaceae archaeon]